jgi:hypothetical protein
MVLNDVHPRYTLQIMVDIHQRYTILNTTAIVGGELYLILVATARRLTGRTGSGSAGVDTVLGTEEELGRTIEEERAMS